MREFLSIQGLSSLDYNAVLTRAMRRQNISRMVRAVKLACVVVVFLAGAFLLIVLIPDLLTKWSMSSEIDAHISKIAKHSGASGTGSLSPAHDWAVVAQRKPFGDLTKPVVAGAAKPAPPPSPLMLSLIGTFITGGQEPYAIIEDKKKNNQDMFILEESIFDQATLKKIYQDRVEIERNGKIEVLMLDDIGGGGAGIVNSSPDDFVVEEAELDKGLENLPLLLTQARAVPYFKDGRSIGLRLFAIKTGSLYEKVGLRNGDILKTINGNNLGDISQALKLFEQLKQERSISLVLERDKQDREFKYTIR